MRVFGFGAAIGDSVEAAVDCGGADPPPAAASSPVPDFELTSGTTPSM